MNDITLEAKSLKIGVKANLDDELTSHPRLPLSARTKHNNFEVKLKEELTAVEAKKESYAYPLKKMVVTCPYGPRDLSNKKAVNFNPELATKMHNGWDLRASVGTNLYAVKSGEVIAAGYNSAREGVIIKIKHDDGSGYSGYVHLSLVKVKVGDHVQQSQLIGKTGATGNVTGPHLHLTLRDASGKDFDPKVVFNV